MEYQNTLTTCIYCGCGCAMYVETIDGRLTGVWPAKTNQISGGKLCIKGWNVTGFVGHADRLQNPLHPQGWEAGRGDVGRGPDAQSPRNCAGSSKKAARTASGC